MPDVSPTPVPSLQVKSEAAPLEVWRRSAPGRRQWFGIPESGLGRKALDLLKTLAWVAPLTILIWVYAEREQTARYDSVPIAIYVHSAGGNRIVTLIDPAPPDRNLLATLAGPRASLDKAVRDIGTGAGGHPGLSINLDPSLKVGRHSLDALNQLADNPLFRQNGISIKSVRPAFITVDVDQIESQELPVKAPAGLDTLSREPVFTPPTIRVQAPSLTFRRAEREGKMFLVADLSNREELKRAGHHELNGIPVSWSMRDPDNTTFGVAAVKADIEVKQGDVAWTIPSVPIWPSGSPQLLNAYKVDLVSGPSIFNVKVIGPPEGIALLTPPNGHFPVVARLDVSSDDAKADQEVTKDVTIQLPAGVKLVDPVEHVRFRLERREDRP